MLTPIPWRRWSEATFGSTPYFLDRLALVFRRTWKVAQPKPIFTSFGGMERRQRLSADNGVASASLGNTNPCGLGSSARSRHSFSIMDVPSYSATSRDLPFLWRVEDAFVNAFLHADGI